jgi:hypothetical protein
MPLAYLLDEHVRGLLWRHVQRHNAFGRPAINAVRVGDPPDLPLGALDPAMLLWAEKEDRIVVSRDKGSLVTHLRNHLAAGHHSPGIFLLRDVALAEIVEFLACAAHASEPVEWQDRVVFIP